MRLSSSITEAGSRPASTRRCSGRGARAAASAAALSFARSISASDGSKAVDVGDLDADLAALAVVHGAADQDDLVGLRAAPRSPAMTFSKTSSSTWPSRSSSVANITVEPERVLIFLHAAIIPPTFTHSPSRRSGTSAHVASAFTRSASRTALERVLGDEDADRLLLHREQLALVELLDRDRRVRRAGERRRAAAVLLPAEAAEVEDRALADLRVELRLLAGGLRGLEHVEHALARGARWSRTRRT